MLSISMRPLLPLLCAGLISCAQSQPQAAPKAAQAAPKAAPYRALIVSGGPSPDYNQYAIESNARYLEKVTAGARSRRILFADGSKISRTISALEDRPDAPSRALFAYLFETDDDSQRETLRAPELHQIDGPATKKSVLDSVQSLANQVKPGEHALIYFTGHGSPGQKPRGGFFGARPQPDFDNTSYALWKNDDLSTLELGAALKNWPQNVPLVMVMVQCHAGGFANLLFEGGDPKNPLAPRDFCGFFAATGDRMASGCTSQVDEADYQDFTTHFFAALSGFSRDGQPVKGADFDRNGAVSPLEAYAWTNLQDSSIDIPVCTSDAYLRHIFPQKDDASWLETPYLQLLEGAAPWQKAVLEGLSRSLQLRGEARLRAAMTAHDRVMARVNSDELPDSSQNADFSARFDALENALKTRFVGLSSAHRSREFAGAKTAALKWLQAHPSEVEPLSRALTTMQKANENDEAREAMLWRFVRAARTIVLQRRLAQSGSAEQKAVFARLRISEGRGLLGA